METLTDTYKAYKEASAALWDAVSQRDEAGTRLPIPLEVSEAFDTAMTRHQTAFLIAIYRAKVGDTLHGLDFEMTVVRKSASEGIVLSSDGGEVIREWHDGPDGNADVFYEVYDLLSGGRCTHGYLDACSRRIVQLG